MEAWRELGKRTQTKIVEYGVSLLRARLKKGNETYNSEELGFQGDPVAHAFDEAGDLLVYLYIIRRYVRLLERLVMMKTCTRCERRLDIISGQAARIKELEKELIEARRK